MTRTLNRLNVKQVASLTKPGRHADGGGLYLRITSGGSRSWVFMVVDSGKRAEIGLGPTNAVSLAAARRIAAEMREAHAIGRDPRTVIAPSEPVEKRRVPTFAEFAEDYISSVEAGWKNAVHRQQWRNSLRDHASQLRDLPINAIGSEDIIAVLRPIWLDKAETAKRVRSRIEKILDAAKVRGHRPMDALNPATFKGHLALILPPQKRLQRGHHAALPYAEVSAFMAQLRQRDAPAARCLEFVILTAARSSEALGATWAEIDLYRQMWSVPAERMKAGRTHEVPLSPGAIDLLKRVKPDEVRPGGLVFGVGGVARSNMAMNMLLRRMNRGDITTHGFRSTFRDWAGDQTDFPRELIEQALAHTIGSKVERAYRRGTAVQRRRDLMNAWSTYLDSSSCQPQPEKLPLI